MERNEYLGKLIQAMQNIDEIRLFGNKAKFTRTEFRMLREIATEREKGNEIISSELARRLGVTRSAISQLAAKLEQRGIIERVPSPVDKKIAYVRLSEKSIAFYEEQCAVADEVVKHAVEEVGKDRVDELFHLIDEFNAALMKAHASIVHEAE